jgi:hypothetical protein
MSTSQNPNVGRRSNGDRAPGSGSGSSGSTAYRSGRLGRAPLHQGWQPAGRACIVALVRGGVAWQGGRCIGEGRCVREGRGGASGRVAAVRARGEECAWRAPRRGGAWRGGARRAGRVSGRRTAHDRTMTETTRDGGFGRNAAKFQSGRRCALYTPPLVSGHNTI